MVQIGIIQKLSSDDGVLPFRSAFKVRTGEIPFGKGVLMSGPSISWVLGRNIRDRRKALGLNENVSLKVIRIVQSFTGVVDETVWRK